MNPLCLISLFSFLLVFAPANRALWVSAWVWPKFRLSGAPAWSLWLLRAQTGAIYFFAGVAKIAPDWLHGEPLRGWFKQESASPMLTRFLRQEWVPYVASYASLAFDLLIVPFLLWRRTR